MDTTDAGSKCYHRSLHSQPTRVSQIIQPNPLPHPEPQRDKVARAREACSEALSFIASIEEELSVSPGTKPERRYEFWLHHLRFLTGYLVMTMEENDARQQR
jgi:hypothetical protein